MMKEVQSKEGRSIEIGDTVTTRFRGGKHEGKVEAVIRSEQDLEDAGDLGVVVKNPPKVIFTDQHGHRVAHNPGTLTHVDDSRSE
ncbi:uncharacterized protein FIBRA_04381 [Fibroporia radiculosa]|uniref:Hypervirulence associated protein TUDOR domain-containing protein n=1 Tax=Fibroporia radiculosa TaxID=599839 RepID=J4G798_9APHY|nr:uncharacterized protein FIBRA_04381 [Fibroporia radiculosa]CCM02293.1 predicted protein [Fibroporia radiculosa]